MYCASSLKQQSADRDVAPLGHIILIPKQPVFALSPSGEATNVNFIVFWFDQIGDRFPEIYQSNGIYTRLNRLFILDYFSNKKYQNRIDDLSFCIPEKVCSIKQRPAIRAHIS
jgi:hypothetical protein